MYSMFYFMFVMLLSCNPNNNKDVQTADSVAEPDLVFDTCSQQIDSHPCNFSLKNQRGDNVELYDFYGKVIIIDFSAMWCGPCFIMAQSADPIVDDYGSDNVEWLTVIIENETGLPPDQSDLERWAVSAGITGHVLASSREMIDQSATSGYPVSSWPTFVVVDQQMVLRYGVSGWSESILRQMLDSLITTGE